MDPETVLAWVHLVAATAWVGGMLFLTLVLVPVLTRDGFTAERRLLFQTLARRFRAVVWVSIIVLLGTGTWLLTARPESLLEPAGWPSALKVKLLLVTVLIGLTAIHDFWLGPKVGRLMREAQANSSPADQALIQLSPWVSRLGLVLALAILLLAVAVART